MKNNLPHITLREHEGSTQIYILGDSNNLATLLLKAKRGKNFSCKILDKPNDTSIIIEHESDLLIGE